MTRPQEIGSYRLLRLLAMGGMGEVHLAEQRGPGGFRRPVVIKRLLPHLAHDKTFIELFLNEARLASVLSHPNIVQVLELGEASGEYFLAMEYIRGRSVRELLRKSPGGVPVEVAGHVCTEVLSALHHAHTFRDGSGKPLAIVHRDVSAENILLSVEGAVKVVDFGIAKAVAIHTTRSGGLLQGKYPYIAPEIIHGERGDSRVDIYSTGILLFELLTGKLPFDGPSELSIINAIIHRPAPLLRSLRPELPEALETIAARAMSKDPAARFATAEQMSEELRSALRLPAGAGARAVASYVTPLVEGDLPPSGEELETAAVAGSGQRRELRRWAVLGAGTVAVLALAGLAWLASPARKTPESAPAALPIAPPHGAAPSDPVLPGALAAAELPRPPPEALSPVSRAPASVDVGTATGPPPPRAASTRRDRPSRRTVGSNGKTVAPAEGKVEFQITPWAEVRAGTTVLGLTPMPPVALPSGRHTFTFTNSELGVTRTVSTHVAPDRVTVVRVNLFSAAPPD